MKMMSEYEIKKQICDIGKRIYNRNMVAANDGNISVKISDNEFLCTPTGVSKGFMTPEYICKVDAKGNVLQANKGFKPSSEINSFESSSAVHRIILELSTFSTAVKEKVSITFKTTEKVFSFSSSILLKAAESIYCTEKSPYVSKLEMSFSHFWESAIIWGDSSQEPITT